MTKNSRIKAEIATVQIGHLEIEGLYAPEINQFGVGIVQVCNLFSEPRKRSLKQLEALWGITFQNHQKWTTSLNPKAINVISLIDFERILRVLDRKGNQKAQELSDDLIGLSLHQLFSDAFNHHFEQEERQQWLKARQQGKIARRTLTDAIKDWLLAHPEVSDNKKKFIYSNATDAINLGIFARRASKLRKDWHCDNPRDEMTEKELSVVEAAEGLTMRLIDQDKIEPMAAVHEALNRLIIPVVER
jgi:hypothetical protein